MLPSMSSIPDVRELYSLDIISRGSFWSEVDEVLGLAGTCWERKARSSRLRQTSGMRSNSCYLSQLRIKRGTRVHDHTRRYFSRAKRRL